MAVPLAVPSTLSLGRQLFDWECMDAKDTRIAELEAEVSRLRTEVSRLTSGMPAAPIGRLGASELRGFFMGQQAQPEGDSWSPQLQRQPSAG